MAKRRGDRKATGARNQQTARAGEYFVAGELNRRGAYAVTFSGNMPGTDLVARNVAGTRTVSLQVKTRRKGTWQTTYTQGRRMRENPNEKHFWVFVDLTKRLPFPEYYIVPDWWIRRDIYKAHRHWIRKKGGQRPRNPKSKHHSIQVDRIKEWKGCWKQLRVC